MLSKRTPSCFIDEPFSFKKESNCTEKDSKMELVASLSFKFNGHSIGSYLNSKLTSISNLINDRVDLSILKLYKFDQTNFPWKLMIPMNY